ncbi:uncharacterized protein LOC143906618 [Temnothorax americanus]|uniref:uncharacterized protein LOC143906618 n=1 Tax=Temnothorax americanus TaxID=1964332 RepID=UPI0040681068
MVLDSICVRWHLISKKCKIPRSEFLIAVRLVLNSTFFTFNSIIYQQIFGSPMGSPLSPTAVDIVMQDLEASALATLKYTPPFFVRYVDDIALATPSSSLDHTLEVFNSFHPRLQFTVEVGEGGRLNFLEITMIRRNNRIIFDWFHKPTFSGRYLNFISQHPVCQKRDRSPDVQPEEAASFFTIPNVVYKINCGDCDASYVGQTGRQLQTRIKEHQAHIRRNTTSRSVITEHRLESGHDFEWNAVEILDSEPYINKRLISEMICIKRQKNGLNMQTDTEDLPENYLDVIEGLPKI